MRVQDSGWLRRDLSKQFPCALLSRARRRDKSVTAVSKGTPNGCGSTLKLNRGVEHVSRSSGGAFFGLGFQSILSLVGLDGE